MLGTSPSMTKIMGREFGRRPDLPLGPSCAVRRLLRRNGIATRGALRMAHVEIEAKGVTVRIDLLFGMISELVVERDGRKVSMLHKVPWLGETMPEDAAPHLGGLAGDFFCAPFGDASADNAPGHGW